MPGTRLGEKLHFVVLSKWTGLLNSWVSWLQFPFLFTVSHFTRVLYKCFKQLSVSIKVCYETLTATVCCNNAQYMYFHKVLHIQVTSTDKNKMDEDLVRISPSEVGEGPHEQVLSTVCTILTPLYRFCSRSKCCIWLVPTANTSPLLLKDWSSLQFWKTLPLLPYLIAGFSAPLWQLRALMLSECSNGVMACAFSLAFCQNILSCYQFTEKQQFLSQRFSHFPTLLM